MREADFIKHRRPALASRRRSDAITAAIPAGFTDVSRRLLVALAFEFDGVISHRELRALVREAEATALATSDPLLVLPTLAEERVARAVGWHRRQQQILDRTVVALAE